MTLQEFRQVAPGSRVTWQDRLYTVLRVYTSYRMLLLGHLGGGAVPDTAMADYRAVNEVPVSDEPGEGEPRPAPEPCPFCGAALTRVRRLEWRCPVHGDITLALVFIYEAEHREVAR